MNVKYVTIDEQLNKNVIVNEVSLLSCENTTFFVCVLLGFSLNMF